MFNSLQDKLATAFKKITGRGSLSKADVEMAMKEVRMALLEADVNYKVAKDFCERVAQKAIGEDVLKSLTPGQQVVKIVNDELTEMMGTSAAPLNLSVPPPAIILLAGLQGSGKTTTAAKLALRLKKDFKKKPFLVPADIYRPAAIEQLKTLAKGIQVDVFDSNPQMKPVDIASEAVRLATLKGLDVVIIDTAGRLQIDDNLMQELQEIATTVRPHEILLVADAMTGQEAVNVAKGFHEAVRITGLILTKLDGDARGGAALSMRAVTGCPIKFIGVSEKPDGLEVFHPDRLASRILGMGDVLGLIEKATQEISMEDGLALQKKMRRNEFSFEDFLGQLRMIRKMGPISGLLSMMPGIGKMADQVNNEDAEKEMKRIEAIILSMTPKERNDSSIINGSRRKRIAKGSGTSVEQVNTLLKQFMEMKKMMSQFSKLGMGGLAGKGMGALMGGRNPLAGMMKRG
jgi:signal recognition particle subunit SRP54